MIHLAPMAKKPLIINKWKAKANPRIEVNRYRAIKTHQKPFKTYFENVRKCERLGYGHSHFCIN
jgi:hypothetical protein